MSVPGDESTRKKEAPPAQAQGRRSQRQWQTRLRLLEGARNVFARVGVAEATIAQITAEADLGFGTFYLYFKTKDDALHAVLVEGFTPLNAEIDEIQRHAHAQQMSWEETLKLIVVAYLQFARENRDLMQIMFAEQVRVQQAELRVFLSFAWRIVLLLKRAYPSLAVEISPDFSPGSVGGSVIAYPLNLLTTMIVGIFNRAAIWWLRQPASEGDEVRSLERVSEMIAQFITAGLKNVLTTDQAIPRKDQENDQMERG